MFVLKLQMPVIIEELQSTSCLVNLAIAAHINRVNYRVSQISRNHVHRFQGMMYTLNLLCFVAVLQVIILTKNIVCQRSVYTMVDLGGSTSFWMPCV